MGEILNCWRCGTDLAALSLPLGRMDECPDCLNHLHVCRMCVYFDPRVAKQCREDDADEVKEKERANFCDYFRPTADAHDPRFNAAEAAARASLAGLFGECGEDGEDGEDTDARQESGSASGDNPLDSAEALFRDGPDRKKDDGK